MTPIGNSADGTFTYKNKKDSANGTLDFMNMIVDRKSLNMSEENFNIQDDELSYNFNGLELTCTGLHKKCVGWVMPFSYSDEETKTQGTLDEMLDSVDPTSLDLTNPVNYVIDDDTFIYDDG